MQESIKQMKLNDPPTGLINNNNDSLPMGNAGFNGQNSLYQLA